MKTMKLLTKKEKKIIKRYLKSTTVTFFTGFILGSLPLLQDISMDNFTQAFVFGVVFAGLRGGFKGLAELTIFKK